MNLSSWEITTDILYQLGALNVFVKMHGEKIQHVAPHGRLGNLAVVNRKYAEAIADAVEKFDPSLYIVTQPGELANIAKEKGLKVVIHILADRAYLENGTLVPRMEPNAVIHDPEIVVERCVKMISSGKVETISGKEISVEAHTLCLHGDTLGSVELAKRIKKALVDAGVEIRKLEEWL